MPEPAPRPDPAFLDTASALGARLCRDALWDGNRCNWVGSSMEFVGRQWRPVERSFGPDVYAGTAGIALFLARLFAATGEPPLRRAAEGAAAQALSRAGDLHPSARAGYYVGQTGLAHVLTQVGLLLDRPALVEAAESLAEDLPTLDLPEQGLDVLSGVAGAIPALLDLSARMGRPALLDLARRCGERLLDAATRGGPRWSWGMPGEAPGTPHLTGFSHGAGGIAWALLELHRATGDARFREAAEGGFAYERSRFSPAQGNWPDLRESVPGAAEQKFMVAWCHGAPGIGLSRLRAFELTGSAPLREEAATALQTTAAMLRGALAGMGGGFSLCHGLAGNADVLLTGARVLGDPQMRALAGQVGQMGAALYGQTRSPWPCGVMGGGETPNLMLGLAGIGFFYLRLHDPALPSVLLPGLRGRWPGVHPPAPATTRGGEVLT